MQKMMTETEAEMALALEAAKRDRLVPRTNPYDRACVPRDTQTLPTDRQERKDAPVYSGVLRYFPLALIAVADCSRVGNDQHNPGQPLHWAKEKSTDEHDTLIRHIMEAGTRDSDGVRHSAKVAWRALAALQREIEADGEKPGAVTSAS